MLLVRTQFISGRDCACASAIVMPMVAGQCTNPAISIIFQSHNPESGLRALGINLRQGGAIALYFPKMSRMRLPSAVNTHRSLGRSACRVLIRNGSFCPEVCDDLTRRAQTGSDRPAAKGLLHTG